MRTVLLVVALQATLLLTAACLQEEEVEPQDIVDTIPWQDEERAEYVLLKGDDEEERGRAVLSVTRQGGQFELRLLFEGQGDTDEAVVLVDATTLKPASVRREISVEGKTTVGEYKPEEEIVEITEIDEGGDERTVPLRLPEHYYDNESSFFLWRTVPLEEGYKASYNAVLVNQRGSALATLRVVGVEEVTVPAGTFQAWRVEIEAGSGKPVAWYADTPERPLVQVENDDIDLLIQLTSINTVR